MVRRRPKGPDVLELLGFVTLVIGCGWAWLPLGFIVGGIGLLVASWAIDGPEESVQMLGEYSQTRAPRGPKPGPPPPDNAA